MTAMFADREITEPVLFGIANRLYDPSYVSFETALAWYGLIPESVYQVTSASTRKTARFSTEVAGFSYRTLKPSLFWGYVLQEDAGEGFKIARPEKAILDFLRPLRLPIGVAAGSACSIRPRGLSRRPCLPPFGDRQALFLQRFPGSKPILSINLFLTLLSFL